MALFSEFDFEECYGEDIRMYCIYRRTIDELLDDIWDETNPQFFRNKFLAIVQLFFDGMVSRPLASTAEIDKLRTVFGDILSASRKSINSFYRGRGVAPDDVRTVLDTYSPAIIDYSSRKLANDRHIDHCPDEILRWALGLEGFVNDAGIDTVVCVANGGFEPSFLITEMAGIDNLIPIRFSNYNRYDDPDDEVKVPTFLGEDYIEQAIANKRVLVVEDIVSSGESLLKVMRYVDSKGPSVLYGSSVLCSRLQDGFVGTVVNKVPFICTL